MNARQQSAANVFVKSMLRGIITRRWFDSGTYRRNQAAAVAAGERTRSR